MLKLWKKRKRLGRFDLPDDVELLSYLDGEVSPERHAEIEKLNEESWEIRLRLAELNRDIETYTKATSQAVPDEVPPFEEFWKSVPSEAVSSPLVERSHKAPSNRKTAPRAQSLHFFKRLGLLGHLPLPSTRLAAALCVLLAVGAIFLIRIISAPPVSAKELLKWTISAEDQRIHAVTAPVIYQKLRVHRKSLVTGYEEAATWEVWNDANHRRFRQRVESASGAYFVPPNEESVVLQKDPSAHAETRLTGEDRSQKTNLSGSSKEDSPDRSGLPPVLSELTQVYQANRMNQQRPLSPESFEAWQSQARKRTDTVEEVEMAGGLKAFVLTTEPSGPFTENAILRGELLVRVADWHPVAQRLRVQGVQGILDYQVTESEFQVLALNALDPAIFSSFMPAPSTTAEVSATGTSSVESPDPADLLAAEIEAHYALHRIKACLGESIEVVPFAKGRIEVRGLAVSAEQKEKLIGELRRVPFVSVRVQTIQEAMKTGVPAANQGQIMTLNAPPSEPTITVRSPRLPIQEQLERYLEKPDSSLSSEKDAKTPHNIPELSTEAVTLSRSALSNAWALRRLAEAFGPSRMNHACMQSKWLLEAMVRDHLHEIRAGLDRSQDLFGPILDSFPSRNALSAPSKTAEPPIQSLVESPNWVSQALILFRNVEQMDLLTNGLFAGAELPAHNSEQAVQDLLLIYADLPIKCEGLERQITKDFSSTENPLTTQKRPQ